MSDEPVMKDAVIAGAYYDEAKRAIVLNAEIDGIESTFQTPMPESYWTFPPGCDTAEEKEAMMRKTAEMFNAKKGGRIKIQFDGGIVNGDK